MIEETTTMAEFAAICGANLRSLTLTYSHPSACWYSTAESQDERRYGIGSGPLPSDAIRAAITGMRELPALRES